MCAWNLTNNRQVVVANQNPFVIFNRPSFPCSIQSQNALNLRSASKVADLYAETVGVLSHTKLVYSCVFGVLNNQQTNQMLKNNNF